MDFKNIGNSIFKFVNNNSSEILCGIGIAGMFLGAVELSNARLKADKILEKEKQNNKVLTVNEKIRLTWKQYHKAALLELISAGCIIFAQYNTNKKYMLATTSCEIIRQNLKDYKDKVIEKYGPDADKEIQQEIVQDRSIKNACVMITDNTTVRFIDSLSGKEFQSTINKVNSIRNDVNRDMLSEMYISVNEWLDALGISSYYNDDRGWNLSKTGFIEPVPTAQIDENGNIYILLEYLVNPIDAYNKMY